MRRGGGLAEREGAAVGILEIGEVDTHCLGRDGATTRPRMRPRMTAVPIGGFTSLTIEAPLKETSMTRQLCTSPFGKINLEDGLRGTMRSCRRSSESPRRSRLMSQVS